VGMKQGENKAVTVSRRGGGRRTGAVSPHNKNQRKKRGGKLFCLDRHRGYTSSGTTHRLCLEKEGFSPPVDQVEGAKGDGTKSGKIV